jgi:MFS family permease
MDTSDQEKIERKVFTSFLQAGFIEAFTGIILLQLGLPALFSRSGFGDWQSALLALPIALILLIAVFLVRKFVVTPRIGRVKFLPERRRRLSKLILVPTLTLIAGAIVGYIFAENDSLRHIFVGQIPFILIPIIVFGAAAYFLNMKRLYVYGAIVGLVFPLGKYLETVIVSRNTLPATILFTAFVFLGIAIVFLVAFLRKYHEPRV